MEEELVLRERRGKVLILTINRPEKGNSIIPGVAQLMDSYLSEAEADDSVGAIIITGAGPKIFCSGMDLLFLAQHPEESGGLNTEHGWGGIAKRFCPKPVIAAVNGYALGGGMEIALACDLIVASENAVFGLPEVKRGLMAAGGGLIRLAKQLPRALALEIALTGDNIPAARAREMGLVAQVTPQAELMDAALALAGRIASNAPLSLRCTKELLYKSMYLPDEEAWALSDRLFAGCLMKSEDMAEGARAFAEKRPPQWKGR